MQVKKLMGHTQPLFRLFLSFQTNVNFLGENVHLVYSAGIQTHNLQNISLLP